MSGVADVEWEMLFGLRALRVCICLYFVAGFLNEEVEEWKCLMAIFNSELNA